MIRRNALRNRIWAVLLLVAALLLIWFGAGVPYAEALARSDQRLAAATAQLQLYRSVSARHTGNATGVVDDAAAASVLLPGASAAGAAAYLQQTAGTIIGDAGALLLSFELLPVATGGSGPLQAVAGRMRVTGNTASLSALLHALETHRPVLLIDNIFVRARNDQDTVPGGHLDVQLDVTGYRPPEPLTP